MKKIKIVLIIVVILIAMIITFAIIDFKRVTSGEKPIFCIDSETRMDGGTIEYSGLGYKIIDYHKMLPTSLCATLGLDGEMCYYNEVKINLWFMPEGDYYDEYVEKLSNEIR